VFEIILDCSRLGELYVIQSCRNGF